MDTKIKVEIRIPPHECKYGYGDGNSTKMVTLLSGKETFRCGCGKQFSIAENLNITPECVVSEGVYTCSVTEKELYFNPRRAEVVCINSDCPEKHRCTIGYGGIFDEIIQGAYQPGFYNESGVVNQGAQRGKGHHSKMNSIPLKMMDSLGLQGLIVHEEEATVLGKKYTGYSLEMRIDGETRTPKYISENLYDIGHDRFYLFHKLEHLIEYKEHSIEKAVIDKEPSHVGALIEKSTKRMYIIPKANKDIFGFTFKGGTLYAYLPQKGYNLADGDAFRDNSRFVAYKTKEILPNPKTNSNDKIYGYLVEESKIDEFKALTKRPTRIISSDDYSGVPQHQKELLWKLKNNDTRPGVLEVIDQEFILKEYRELLELVDHHPAFETSDITDFEDIDIDDVIADLKEDFNLDEKDCKNIEDRYYKMSNFITEFCNGCYGPTEEVLEGLHLDVTNPDYIDFKRYYDKFTIGNAEDNEYHNYSNYDLIQACKHRHEMKLVRTTSAKNQEAIKHFKAAGTLKGQDPRKDGTAQDVAFEEVSEYTNLVDLIENNEYVKQAKVWGPKPKEEWSEQDYNRYDRGQDVKEITNIVVGMKVDKDKDPITRHCLYNEPLPEELAKHAVIVSGSRVMSLSLRTYRDKDGYYVTPAVNVWKGYFIENEIKLLFARCAKGSDCAAIIAAIEINEYLYNKVKAGELTEEQYYNEYITIVIVGHSWYKSIDFNNHGLTSIIDRAIYFDGYFTCAEPYRKKRSTETTISHVEYFDERENRLKVFQTYDAKDKRFKNLTIKRFHRFDRKIERANKRLVSLGGPDTKLVILCRSEYSGTTNTMNFAIEAGKDVIEITSPLRETPIDFRAEDDPIQKGHSDFEYYNEFWDTTLVMVPSFISNYAAWYQKTRNINKYRLGFNSCYAPKLNVSLGAIPEIQVRRVEYKRKPRYVKTIEDKYVSPENIRCKPKTSKSYEGLTSAHIVATVPSTISNYSKWYQTIDAMKSGFMWIGVESKTYGTIIKHHKKDSFIKRAQSAMSSSKTKTKSKLTKEDLIKVYPELKAYYDNWSNTDSRTWVKTKDNKRLA